MNNLNAPRRSARIPNARGPDRLQLRGPETFDQRQERRRQDHQRQNQRRHQQQRQHRQDLHRQIDEEEEEIINEQLEINQQNQPRPEEATISNFPQYSREDKQCLQGEFLHRLIPNLALLLIAFSFGKNTEISLLLALTPQRFNDFMLNILPRMTSQMPWDPIPVGQVLTPFDRNGKIRNDIQPFLYEFNFVRDPHFFANFLRRFFTMAILSDDLLYQMCLIFDDNYSDLPYNFIVGCVRGCLSSAEIRAESSTFFCMKCKLLFSSDKAILSHAAEKHNWCITRSFTDYLKERELNRLLVANMQQAHLGRTFRNTWTKEGPALTSLLDARVAQITFETNPDPLPEIEIFNHGFSVNDEFNFNHVAHRQQAEREY